MTRPQSRQLERKVKKKKSSYIVITLSLKLFECFCCLFVHIRALKSILSFLYFPTAPPMFLPISSTPQPERRQTPQRRHSIEKETPTNVRQFQPPTKHNSKSLVSVCGLYSVKGYFLNEMGRTELHCGVIFSPLTTQEGKLWVKSRDLGPYWAGFPSSLDCGSLLK